MKKSLLLASAATMGALALTASPASALSLTVTEGDGLWTSSLNTTVKLNTDADPAFEVNYNTYFGSFNITDGSNNFVAFCLDLLDHLSFGGTYNYSPTSAPFDDNFPITPLANTTVAQIESYFDTNYGGLVSDADYAAFQLGLWELVYDGPVSKPTVGTTYFNTGILQATGDVVSQAIDFLDELLTDPNPLDPFKLTFLDSLLANGNDNQDLVIVQDSDDNVSLVPLPAAGWLLGGGLFSLLGFGRFGRSRKAATA